MEVINFKGSKILEFGTGAGVMSQYFGKKTGKEGQVDSVDVIDQRQATDGYAFHTVRDTSLPFSNAYYDIVISNHVIEHVGDHKSQLHHLREIRRVLKTKGYAYIAVPNRWWLIEPHYKLPFLSLLPRRFRSSYLRITGKGDFYDCEPLSYNNITALLKMAGFDYELKTITAIRLMIEIESISPFVKRMLKCPAIILDMFLPVMPTLIFLISPRTE